MDHISGSRIAPIGSWRARLLGTRRHSHLNCIAVWVAIFISSLAAVASAQQYQADKVDDKDSKLGGIAQNMVKDSAKYATDKAQFADYFTNAYFPAMTRFEADDLAKLGTLRYDLFNRYLWATQNEALQADLTKIAFEKMKVVAAKSIYHPAVRYNSILVIGQLDDQYAIDSGSNKRPPKPSKEANKLLTQVVIAGIKGDPRVTPSLMVGALVGLERHAQYHDSLDPKAIGDMTDAAIELAAKNPPMADVDSKVAEWIRVQGATVLAKLGAVGPGNKAHDALIQVLADDKLTLDGRCEVAGLLALVNYKDAKVDGKSTVEKIMQLALEVGQTEDKRAKDFQEQSLSGGGGMSMSRERGGGRGDYGGYGGGYGGYSSSGEHSTYDRRTLLSRLEDLRKGLVAIKPVAPADRAPGIEAVIAAMQTVIDAASNKDTTDLDLAEKARKMFDAIQAATKVGTATAAGKPAADAF